MKKDYSNYVLPVGALILVYFAGTKILEAFGIVKSQTETDNQNLLLPGSAFDPNFYKNYSGAKLLLTQSSANTYATLIHDSVSALWFNNPAIFIGVLQNMKTKSQVSFLADTFQSIYGQSMVAYLAGYLTPDQLAQGARIAAALPSYLA